MAVEIRYCPTCSSYDVRAASLAAELNANGLDAAIVEGAKSQFDVISDGELVFSKQQRGRFPEHSEILATLETA